MKRGSALELLPCLGKARFEVPKTSNCGPRTLASRLSRAGCSKGPSSKAAASEEARRTLRYVEPLSAARTLLADVFSIRLVDQRCDLEGLLNQAIARERL